jgi:conjugal transfer ATP-binding protein TraC
MKAVLFALILSIEEAMYQSPRHTNKLCVIDEAWRHLNGENKEASQFIEKGFRTARKHQGAFCTIVQSIKDFHQSREAQAAWNNADIKFILRQNEKAFKEFLEEFPDYFTPYEQTLIKGFGSAKDNGFSEFLLQLGSQTSFHRLFVDPFSRVLYSSDGKEFSAVEQYKNQGFSLTDAIAQVAQHKFGKELNNTRQKEEASR